MKYLQIIRIRLLFIIGFFLIIQNQSYSQIYEPEGLNLPGQWNEFTNPPDSGSVFGSFTQTLGGVKLINTGTRRWQAHLQVANTGANAQPGLTDFLFTSGPSSNAFANKWAGVNVISDSLQNYQFNAGADNRINLQNNKVYTMNWEDRGYMTNRAIFMETSEMPVQIENLISNPSSNSVNPNTPVQIQIQLSNSPSPEEKFYLRYTTNFFVTDTILPIAINQTQGLVTIPGFNEGVSVSYYVFSSTKTNPIANIDLLTLEFLNNNGLNFIYNVINQLNTLNLGDDLIYCPGTIQDTLYAGNQFETYLWSTGETTSSISVQDTGLYWVEVSINNEFARDSMYISTYNIEQLDLPSTAVICGNTPLELSPNVILSPMGDSLTIIYNAALGQTQLIGATSVYMHSTYEAVPFGGPINPWVGNWGVNDGLGQMIALGNDLWKITINVYDYYSVNPDSSINGLFLVFRNANGTATGKDDLGNEIFINLSGSNASSTFAGISAINSTSGFNSILWSTNEISNSISIQTPGIYWVSISGNLGCIQNDTILVSSALSPILELGPNELICNNQPITINSNGIYSSYNWSNGATTPSIETSISGTYILSVTNDAGCAAEDQITVESYITPVASFSSTTNGLIVSFTNETIGTGSYSWDFNNDGTIDDATSGDVEFGYLTSGQYTVRLIVQNSCGADTAYASVTVSDVGTSSVPSAFSELAFPNPTKGAVHLISLNDNDLFRLRNSSGIVISEWIIAKKGSFEYQGFEELSSGIYLLERISNSGNSFQRIVKID